MGGSRREWIAAARLADVLRGSNYGQCVAFFLRLAATVNLVLAARETQAKGIGDMSRLRAVVKGLLGRNGWDVRKIGSPPRFPTRTALETGMAALIAAQGRIRVVQVGANDGVVNDPLHDFLMKHRDQTEVLLIEPQPYLIPMLAANYQNHPAHHIQNLAVGERGSLLLHTIDERYWTECAPPYADGWPAYRAPTGVSSSDREIVLAYLRRYYKGELPVEDLIVDFSTECMPLTELMERARFAPAVDVLQVDCEGFDDEVLYNSSLDRLKPKLINFEETELSPERLAKLSSALSELGYTLQSTGNDVLAILDSSLCCQ